MTTTSVDNLRASRRKGLRVDCTLLLDAQAPRNGLLVDVGTDGASFTTARPVAPGSRGELHFDLVVPAGRVGIAVRVRTVYSSFVGGPAGARFRIGASFVTPDAATLAALEAFVADPR